MILARLLGQIRRVGRTTVLDKDAKVSKTFSDSGQHFFRQQLDVNLLRVHLDTLLDEDQRGLGSIRTITPAGFIRRKWARMGT